MVCDCVCMCVCVCVRVYMCGVWCVCMSLSVCMALTGYKCVSLLTYIHTYVRMLTNDCAECAYKCT